MTSPLNPILGWLATEIAKRRHAINTIPGAITRSLPNVSGPMSTSRGSGGTLGAQPKLRQIFGSISGTGKGRLEQNTGIGQDPLSLLFQQLLSQLQQPTQMPTGINTSDLMAQVRSAIDPIYNQRAGAAKERSARGREEVKGMYRGLANDYERLAPEQDAQAAEAQEEIKSLYGELRSNIEGSYSRISEEQGDLFEQLGIEEALPDVLAPQQEATIDASNRASELQAINEQRYVDQGNIDETYYREGAPLATMTGVNTSKDMLFELEQYLQQIEAERTSGIQTSYTQLLGQAQEQLMQQQQMAQSENARKQGMLWNILQAQMQGAQNPAKMDVNSFMAQLPSGLQQSVGAAFTRLQRSPEAVYGKTLDPRNPVPGTFVDTTPQWFMQQADEMLKRGEIDEATYQALLMYLQLSGG